MTFVRKGMNVKFLNAISKTLFLIVISRKHTNKGLRYYHVQNLLFGLAKFGIFQFLETVLNLAVNKLARKINQFCS